MTADASNDASNRTPRTAAEEMAQLDCHGTVRRLWDYLDRRLSLAEVRAIDAHLAGCTLCPPHFAFERAFLDAVAAAGNAPAEHDAAGLGTLRARIIAALHAEGYDAA